MSAQCHGDYMNVACRQRPLSLPGQQMLVQVNSLPPPMEQERDGSSIRAIKQLIDELTSSPFHVVQQVLYEILSYSNLN